MPVVINQTPTQTQYGGSLVEMGSYITTTLSLGPSAYWPLAVAVNGTTPDLSGNRNTGTLSSSGITPNVNGPFNRMGDAAMAFNGSSGYIQTSWQQSGVIAYSIEAWVNLPPTNAVALPLVSDRGNGSGLSLTLAAPGPSNTNTNGVGFLFDSASIAIGVNTTQTVADNTWHHIVGCWSAQSGTSIVSSQFTIFVDGVLAATTPVSVGSATSPLTGNGGTTLMYDASWGYRAGTIAHIAIYNYALSAAQVALLWNAGQGQFLDSTIPA